jgi:hypothetical protein
MARAVFSGLLIHEGRSAPAPGARVRLRRLTRQNQAHGRRQHQGQEPQSHDPLMSFHPHYGLKKIAWRHYTDGPPLTDDAVVHRQYGRNL